MFSISERSSNKLEFYRMLLDNNNAQLRVAIPAIVKSFDANSQTITAQITIKERIKDKNGNLNFVEIAPLLDVPLVLPKAGNFVLTMPVQEDDECLIIFADQCIDSWWQNGGIQNWNDKRRHDLSDGFAILGTWSQPNKIPNYSTNSAQLRTKDGSKYIELTETGINIVGDVNVTGTLSASVDVKVAGKAVKGHVHVDPQGGMTGAF